jgi:isochorismate synthase
LKQVISVLHPTPAVCGLPKQQQRFYFGKQGYDREYYTILGELNKEGLNKDTLKNLICTFKMHENHKRSGALEHGYVTKDSNPRKEWERERVKSMTMKKGCCRNIK